MDKGDVDLDSDVDINEAYAILLFYANKQVNNPASFHDDAELNTCIIAQAADIDEDGMITINDAYLTLCYYAHQQVGLDITWENLLSGRVDNY